MKKVGLVGGISWTSTLDYYRYINEGVNAKLGGLNFAELVIYSVNYGEVSEKSWDQTIELFVNACNSLKNAGVESIALCANTAHQYIEELEQNVDLPFINIMSETALNVKAQGFKKVGLLGTKYTMEMSFYRKKLESFGLEVFTPEKQETRDYIQETLRDELGAGIINPKTKEQYVNIVEALTNQGAEAVILGCTEIPLLIGQKDFDIPIFDTTKIHSDAIVAFMVS